MFKSMHNVSTNLHVNHDFSKKTHGTLNQFKRFIEPLSLFFAAAHVLFQAPN